MSDIPKFGVYKGMMESYEESMMSKYKVEMIVEIKEGHPRKWIPETIEMGLEDGEDILEWSIEEVESE